MICLIDYSTVTLSVKKGMACITLCHFWTIIIVRIKKVNLQINYLLAMTGPLLRNHLFCQRFILPLVTVQSKFLCHTYMVTIDKGFMMLIINPFLYLPCWEDTMWCKTSCVTYITYVKDKGLVQCFIVLFTRLKIMNWFSSYYCLWGLFLLSLWMWEWCICFSAYSREVAEEKPMTAKEDTCLYIYDYSSLCVSQSIMYCTSNK